MIDKTSPLENSLTEAQQKIAALEAELAATKAELEQAKADPPSTVNATKWESSVSAAFSVWADIVLGDKTAWLEEEFRTALRGLCKDYHTTVLSLAWSLLPGSFKHGLGRPKKTPKTSNSLES